MINSRTFKVRFFLGLMTLCYVSSAYPQTAAENLGPGSDRPALPEFQDPKEPEFILPEVRPSDADKSLGQSLRIFVKRFEFSGNAVISDDEIKAITAPYENKSITSAEIQEVRRNISLYYVNKGYINSGALLPDQKITDGIVRLQIIEGELTSMTVDGNKDLNSDYISKRLKLGSGPPLNIKDMQTQLKLMQQNPLIKKVNAQLSPGDRPGESILKVIVEENTPYSVALFVNNYRSPSVGALGYGIEAVHRNLTGHGDSISYRGTQTESPADPGLTSNSLSYSFPLNEYDTKIRFHYDGSETTVIEEPFQGLDIASKSDTFGIELTHPVYKTIDTEVSLGIGLDKRKSRSFLLGEPFPFSLGTDNGQSRVTVLRLLQNYSKRDLDQALSVRSVISFGLDALDATIHDSSNIVSRCGSLPESECPDGEFTAWLVQLQYARRFTLNDRLMSVVLRADSQISDGPLLPVEQFSVGGAKSVRGYRENQLVRDNGFVTSLELRIPIFLDEFGSSNVQFVPFIDYGQSWNKGRSTDDPRSISSAGAGFLWKPDQHLSFELYAAKAFRKITGESAHHDLQDSGLHFQMSYLF